MLCNRRVGAGCCRELVTMLLFGEQVEERFNEGSRRDLRCDVKYLVVAIGVSPSLSGLARRVAEHLEQDNDKDMLAEGWFQAHLADGVCR